MHLAIGVIAAIGTLVIVWLIGHIGYRLGCAPLLRVPELIGEPGGGLATGTMIFILIPRVVFQAGLAQPLWLMIGFAMISIPAASLGAAKPATAGAPKPTQSLQAIAAIGAVLSMCNGCALIWWTSSAVRSNLLAPLPLHPDEATAWYAGLQTAAGLDVLAVLAAALWVVLVLRLPVATWLRAIAASACFFTLIVVVVALAMSNAAASEAGSTRALCVLNDTDPTPRVILGSTPHHMAALVVHDNTTTVELRNRPEAITIIGRRSIVQYLTEQAVGEE